MQIDYTQAPYEEFVQANAHPERIRARAALFGIPSVPLREARVLDIGCASALNIISLASFFPSGKFVGIDPVQKHIDKARKTCNVLGLKNLELRCETVEQYSQINTEEFDYILLAGLFSWVPSEVREQILSFLSQFLSEKGLVYVNYNCAPGWSFRNTLRQLFLDDSVARSFDSVESVHRDHMKLLEEVTQCAFKFNLPHQMLLKNEYERLAGSSPRVFLADELGEHSYFPLFRELAELFTANGLEFVTDFSARSLPEVNSHETKVLMRAGTNEIARQQLLDHILFRMFRESIFSRKRPEITPCFSKDILTELLFVASSEPISDASVKNAAIKSYMLPGKLRFRTDDRLLNKIQERLIRARPNPLMYNELAEGLTKEIPSEIFTTKLYQLYGHGCIDMFHSEDWLFSSRPKMPRLTPIARLRAENNQSLITKFIRYCEIEQTATQLALSLTGDRAIETFSNQEKELIMRIYEQGLLD